MSSPYLLISNVGRWLVQQGVITEKQLDEALKEKQERRKQNSWGPLADILIGWGYTTREHISGAFEPFRDRLLFVMIAELAQYGHDFDFPIHKSRLAYGQQLLLSFMGNADRLIIFLENNDCKVFWECGGQQYPQEINETITESTIEGVESILNEIHLHNGSGTIQLDIDGRLVNLAITASSPKPGSRTISAEFQRL